MNAPASFTSYSPEGKPLTLQHLRELLGYNPDTGDFIWLRAPWNHPRLAGQVAGGRSTGYVMIKIDGRKYKAHRLAWLYLTGAWPCMPVDHRDGDPFNNRWSNLREATQAQNAANAARRAGRGLPKGVRRNGRGYTARIRFEKRLINIGTYPTVDEAAAAYLETAVRLYGEFARAA